MHVYHSYNDDTISNNKSIDNCDAMKQFIHNSSSSSNGATLSTVEHDYPFVDDISCSAKKVHQNVENNDTFEVVIQFGF